MIPRGVGVAVAAALVLAACHRVEKRPPPDPKLLATQPGRCLILRDPHAADALVVNSGAQVEAPRCDVEVSSDAEFSTTLNAGSRLDVAELCVAGDINRHGGLVTHPLRKCGAAIDPWRLRPPAPRPAADLPCDDRPKAVNGGTVTLQPGVFCGGLAFTGAPSVTFAPGLYVIRGGDWSFNGGTYRGEGVSVYLADGSKPVFNSGVDLALAPPTDGPRRDVLFDEAPGLAPSALTFNNARGFVLSGIVHLPSRDVVFNSGSRLNSPRLLAVFAKATLNGTVWRIAAPLSTRGL